MSSAPFVERARIERSGLPTRDQRADAVVDDCKMNCPKRATIVFMHPGPGPMHTDPSLNMLHHLSQRLDGVAVFATWAKDWKECRQWRDEAKAAVGRFDYRPVPAYRGRFALLRSVRMIALLSKQAFSAAREIGHPIDAVVGYSPYGVGIAAYLVSRLLKVPLIIQVQNDMRSAYLGHHGLFVGLKRRLADMVARFVMSRASGWHVYFPEQTGDLEIRSGQRRFQFTDFTPVSSVPFALEERNEFLLVGFPWEVKGVDLAIQAFIEAGDELAEWRLRVVGHCPDRSLYERLAGGDPRVMLEGPTRHLTVLDYMSRCAVYLLPSRTEAYGRVAIEAMAAGKPVIGARVGGIPTYVRDGVTGLIVPPEDVASLKSAMLRLAKNAEERRRLGLTAREIVLREHTESRWVDQFGEMVRQVAEARE